MSLEDTLLEDIHNHINKIETRLSSIDDNVSNINAVLSVQAEQLKHHIYRTDLAEETLKEQKKVVEELQKKSTMVEGVFKFMSVIAFLIGFALAIKQLFF